MSVVRRVTEAGLVYFCALFTALGIARVVHDLMDLMGVEAIFGNIVGALLVAFLLLPAVGLVVRTFDIGPSLAQRLMVGVVAVALMFLLGTVEVVFFRRFFEADLNHPPDRVANYITLGLLFFAAVLPMFRERRV